MTATKIRPFAEADFPTIKEIYQRGIETGHATFQHRAKDRKEWEDSLLPECRLVAESNDGRVIGWAALAAVSSRCVYGGVAEVTIYIDPAQCGRGVGTALLTALVEASESAGFWTLEAGIFPENAASIALHRKCGFSEVGRRKKIGKMPDGAWRDTILMERRSGKVGV